MNKQKTVKIPQKNILRHLRINIWTIVVLVIIISLIIVFVIFSNSVDNFNCDSASPIEALQHGCPQCEGKLAC